MLVNIPLPLYTLLLPTRTGNGHWRICCCKIMMRIFPHMLPWPTRFCIFLYPAFDICLCLLCHHLYACNSDQSPCNPVSSEIGENRGCICAFHMHRAAVSLQLDTNTNKNKNTNANTNKDKNTNTNTNTYHFDGKKVCWQAGSLTLTLVIILPLVILPRSPTNTNTN